MAKRLLLNVLVKVLGEFIELNEENLNLGVWSGQIVLNNLKLRSDKFLRNMNVVINHGSVRSLEIKIPWATLLQNPIKIKITGVYLDVGPLDVSSLNVAEEFTRIMEDKLRKLKIADKYLELSSSLNGQVDSGAQSSNKDDSYWSQWTSKIIDNIEVVLSEVHLRYEDSMSVPGKIVSFGCTLESFEISTCDENWQPTAFSSSKTTNSAIAVNKLATIKSLGIYWQVSEPQSISSLPLDEWEKKMHSMIYKLNSGNKPTTQLQYILSPYKNSLFLRLTHNKKQLNGAPKFDILAESSNLQLDLDSIQYQQLFHVLDRFGSIQRSELPNLYCPKVRPTDRASARQWWRYAVKLVLIRPRYIRLVKLSRVSEEDANLSALFSETDAREKRMYEERLSFNTLKLFRQIAILEMTDDLRKKHLKAHGGSEGTGDSSPYGSSTTSGGGGGGGGGAGSERGWIGWLTGGGPATPSASDLSHYSESQRSSDTYSPASLAGSAHGPGEDISIESIISSLNKQEEIQKTANATYLHFSINSSSSVVLSTGLTPIVLCNSTVAFSFTQATNGISFSCELKDFIVIDKLTVNAPIQNIVSVKRTVAEKQLQRSLSYSDLNSRPTLSVLFETKNSKSRLTISALPIELAINKICISRLLTEFSRPENRFAAMAAKKSIDSKSKSVGGSGRKSKRSPSKEKSGSSGQAASGSGGAKGSNAAAPAANSSAGQSTLSSYIKYASGAGSSSSSSSSSSAAVTADEGEGDMEILFEAYAPKIIAPEDSTSDKGYLLLDCGYLVIRGSFKSSGFDLSVSLTDINAGLPQSIKDMYTFGDKSLYLIKPFDIVLGVQNIDKSLANMTVNVEIKPELRGEIDSVKLARLLKALSEVSATFFGGKPAKSQPVNSSSSGNSLMATPHASQLRLTDEAGGTITPVKGRGSGPNRPSAGSSDSDGFMTPHKLPLSLPNSSVKPSARATAGTAAVPISKTIEAQVDAEALDLAADISVEVSDEAPQSPLPAETPSGVEEQSEVDPTRNDLNIRLWIPVLALDLAYNVEQGYHLVFFVRTLQTTIINRPYDKRILFDLSEISIQDSFRSESQKDIAWTPNEGGNLIHIAYTNVNSRKSPLYTNCATEVIANFANLGLNIDVNTVNHLKPFFDVLLAKSPPPPPEDIAGMKSGDVSEPNSPLRVLTRTASRMAQRQAAAVAVAEALTSVVPSPSLLSLSGQDAAPPSGMKINFSMERFSVDLLRVSSNEVAGQELDSAFSLQISRLRCDLDMFDLMKADVTIASVEIFDVRRVSKDYVFRKVFCPAYDAQQQPTSEKMDGSSESGSGKPSDSGDAAGEYVIGDQIFENTADSGPVVEPLIRIVYSQESKSHSLVKVTVSNVTSFVSIDTILDLSFVAMGNFFALLGLFSGPPKQPEKETPTPESASVPSKTTKKSSEADDEDVIDPSEISTSTMNIVVQVINPRLILLEDPTSLESQAIVGRCGIEVHYTRETKTRTLMPSGSSSELTESLHVTLVRYEVFVLRNMMNWRPQPILEPIDVEFHLKRRSINGVGVFSNFQCEVDHIEAKVTFNDLVLAQSILSRRTLTEPGVEAEQAAPEIVEPSSSGKAKAEDRLIDSDGSSVKSPSSTPPSLIVHFGLSSLSLVVVNDFSGQNVPLLRLQLSDTRFFSEGRTSQLSGDGSLNSKVDFYNPSLSVWEPVLDRWRPSVRLYSQNNSNIFEIKSDHTMQLTVSGVMLETLLKSYSVFFHEYDELIERQAIADIVVHNCLGEGVDVQLVESGSDILVMALDGGKSSVVTGIQDKGRGSWRQTMHLPTAVDLLFSGPMKNERMPLFHLPFNINKPKVFNLQPVMSTSTSEAGSVTKVIVMEPIIEEVYENSRYDPVAGRWRQPYLMGDPFEWTDASGTVRKDIQNIALASERWEWQGKWDVDLHGTVGIEIDVDGWEYASSFSFFSIVSPRRTMKQMDVVRRRRWTRTRVPSVSKSRDQETLVRPMTLFWDVQVLKNGSRRVYIRSSFQIVNRLSFPILVTLKHNSWAEEVTLGPIAVEETFCVPLRYSYAIWIRLKPALASGFEWSYYFPCNVQSYDFLAVKDVSCCSSTNSAEATCFRVVTAQTNKSLLISLVPYIVVTNKLLCDMRFTCTSSDNKVEEGEVLSGTSTKLVMINVSTTPKLAIQVGNFSYSAPLSINTVKDDVVNFQLILHSEGNERPRKLILTMKSRIVSSHQGIEIDILSKGAFIDRSGLNVLVSSKATPGVVVMRSTYSTPSVMSEVASCKLTSSTAGANSSSAALKQLSSLTKEGSDDSFVSASSGSELNLPASSSFASRQSSKQPGEIYSSALKSIIVSGSGRTSGDELHAVDGQSLSNLVSHFESQGSLGGGNASAATAAGAVSDVLRVNIETQFSRLVSQLFVNSTRFYELRRANIGDYVYTDNKIVWCHLPHGLWNQMYISTAFADRTHRSTRLIQFRVTLPSYVYVCVDINSSLKWIQTDGFQRISDIGVARRIHKGVLEEFHYAIYGKHYALPQSEVVLRSSWNKSVTSMYAAFIVPCGVERVLPSDETGQVCGSQADVELLHCQVNYGSSALDRRVANQSWSEGCNHLSLFYSCDNIITVAVNKGGVWSDEINVDTTKNAASKGSFEVESEQSNITYQLSYTLQSMPGFFSETQLVTLFPRFVILNCVDEVLFVSQQGSEKFCEYQPFKPEGWHKLSQDFGTEVQFRTSSTQWSLGFVDINEIGASVLYIPSRMNTEATFSSGTVLHVEVKVASASDLCSIIVIIWKETIESAKTAMSICNDTDLPVTVRQAGIEDAHDVGDKLFLFEVCVPGNDSTPFGWADPECGSQVLIAVGDSLKGRVATINMLKSDQLMRLPYNFTKAGGPKGEVVISVVTKNGGHILQISKLDNAHFSSYEEGLLELEMEGKGSGVNSAKGTGSPTVAGPIYGLNFILSSFGVSLVVEKPVRRELLSLYVDGLEVYLKSRGNMQSFELLIQDLQVDNYSETVINPVLLRSKRKDRGTGSSTKSGGGGFNDDEGEVSAMSAMDGSGKEGSSSARNRDEDTAPFVKITVIKELLPNDATPVFKYVAVRMLSVGLEVDSATMQILFTDLLDDLKVLTQSQALALSLPHKWVLNYNRSELFPDHQYSLVNVYQSKINAQGSKMYFKNLIVHPMKLTITFVQTVFPRQQHGETLQSTVLNVFMALVGVEKLQLKMKSFEVEDAMESSNTLMDLVYQSILKDLRSQLTNIAGSLAAIGSPIGFARKVGSGVKAFFYEPYLGAVHSSSDFVSGVKKGTSILLSGVVTGAMDSAVAIVGTASKGISYLSGDAEYVRKRAMIRQQSRANQGGIYEGIKDGSESVMSGFASGMSGLVSKPLEEASKHGLKGFIKGIGLGLMGAAVKPVMGLTDGLTSVAHGISNQVESRKFTYVRPPRALEPSMLDESSLVIVPLDLDAAVAQEFVMKRAKQGKYEDAFLSYVPLDTKGEAVILSQVYVYWRRTRSLWGRVWANISHIVFIGDGVGIMLYSGGPGGSAELVVVPCGSPLTARRVYSVFAANAHRMGYPSKVVPVDTLFMNQVTPSTPRSSAATHAKHPSKQEQLEPASLLNQHKIELSQLGALDGYRFGSANHRQLQQITGNESDVLKRAQYYIEKGVRSWKELDEYIWSMLWEWNCVHSSFGACRCCVTVFINRSDSPIQITRVQMVVGRNVIIMGSPATGFETESRSINPGGFVVIFICAFAQSPLEVGHLRANINTAAFSATVASTQRETCCDAKGGFTVGFLEKSVSEWWCKYVVVMS